MTTDTVPGLDDVLAHVKRTRGFDLTGYKRSTIERRITKRMSEAGMADFSDYLDHLQVHPDDFVELFNTILINVTAFFRDPDHWAFLRDHVISALVANRGDEGPIRVWSAGCSSGEEAYSVAMLLADTLGVDSFRTRVKVYATDLDQEALTQARHARYTTEAVSSVPEDLRSRFFEQDGRRWTFHPEIRRAVIFGRHDLLSDAPIGRIDLLVCRNVLMYFTAESQSQILRHLHFALNDDGHLFLGKAEMMLARSELFTPVSLRHRVFRKVVVDRNGRSDPPPAGSQGAGVAGKHIQRQVCLRDAAFGSVPVAQVVVNVDGIVTLVNAAARGMFGITQADIGRRLADLELSYRPIELRSRIEEALANERPVHIGNVERPVPPNDMMYLDVWVTPHRMGDSDVMGVAVSFEDVTRYERLRRRLVETNQELETVAWNTAAEQLWGMRADEVAGGSFLAPDIGLPVERLAEPIRDVLAGLGRQTVELSAVTRLGRPVVCRVTCDPLHDPDGDTTGGVLMMEVVPSEETGDG
jgi:two-component system CheB/CheR fusion protein